MEKDTIMQESYHNSGDKDTKKCPFCTEPCGYEWCPYEKEKDDEQLPDTDNLGEATVI